MSTATANNTQVMSSNFADTVEKRCNIKDLFRDDVVPDNWQVKFVSRKLPIILLIGKKEEPGCAFIQKRGWCEIDIAISDETPEEVSSKLQEGKFVLATHKTCVPKRGVGHEIIEMIEAR